MGCGCGSSARQTTAEATPEAQPGDWLVAYPSGRTVRFTGSQARRKAQREAIATGGTAWQEPDPT